MAFMNMTERRPKEMATGAVIIALGALSFFGGAREKHEQHAAASAHASAAEINHHESAYETLIIIGSLVTMTGVTVAVSSKMPESETPAQPEAAVATIEVPMTDLRRVA